MALEALDMELAAAFRGVDIPMETEEPEVEPAPPYEAPNGSFRNEVEDRRGQELDQEYDGALEELERLTSNVARIEEEYFEFSTPVRLAGQNERIKSLRSQWDSLTDKMGAQQRAIRDIEGRRRLTGRDLVMHRLQEALEAGED